ncbi:ATP binding [Rhizina undulata]
MALLASKSQYVHQPLTSSHHHSAAPSANSLLSQPSPTNSEFSDGPGLLEDIRSWDERKVGEWLKSIGFAKYESVFEKNNITGEALLECDHSVLKELGITKVGDRLRIFVAVKNLRTKLYGNGKKRNRDTLAALDGVGSASYRSAAQSQHHLTPQQNKRHSNSKLYSNELGGNTLISNSYGRPESPTETEYSRSYQRTPNSKNVTSPPLDSSRPNGYFNNPPNAAAPTPPHARTPRTPYTDYKAPNPLTGSPIYGKIYHKPSVSIMNLDNVRQNCIRVFGEGGNRVIEISGCNTPELVMKRILKKFGIVENWMAWAIYSVSADQDRETPTPKHLNDTELVRISNDTTRPERARLILRKKGFPPSPSSVEFMTAQEIARDQQETAHNKTADAIHESSNKAKMIALTGQSPHEIRPNSPSFSDQLSPLSPRFPSSPRDSPGMQSRNASSKKITAFFGQRPPSELISSNLAEYFPDHEQKVLERTVRNSVRRSRRMSKYNSRLSVATTKSYASTYSDAPPVPSVGDAWLSASAAPAFQLPSFPMAKPSRPLSVRKSILPSASFSDRDSLGAVPEDGESPIGPERKSYMSFDSGSGNSVRDSVNVIVTDTDSNISTISTPATDMDTQPSVINQLMIPTDSDEEDDDYEDYMDDNWNTLRWIKGSLIGSGSFGSVFLALNALTGEFMAVKQVEMPSGSKEDSRKKSMVDALQREIQLLKELQHPNIVQYLGSSSEDNCLNIFLEYVPGGSVAALLNNYGPQKEPLIRNFVRQILTGLAYLHNKDIIHRDIKGANVLVDNKGGIKISDFGISKKVESGSHRPSMQGSVFWMAPEVVKQTSYTRKADIWSLGCLIVEMFTGSHPYPDCSQMQAIFKIGSCGSAPAIPPKSTAEAKTFLSQTFELDHVKRPTANELLLSPFLMPMVGPGSSSDSANDS